MKTKQTFLLLLVLLAGVGSLQAAALSVSIDDPIIDGADIALLPGDTVTENPNNPTTAAWFDKPHQGQTFTTGPDTAGYVLTSVSLLHNFGPSSFVWVNSGPWEVMIGTIDGSGNFNVIASETIALSAPDGFTSSDGVADWLTFTLETPVLLDANTTYAFAVGINFGDDPVSHTGAVFVKSDNDGDYAGGTAISDTTGGGSFDNPVVNQGFDRVFHINLYSGVALNPDPDLNEEDVALDTILTWDNPTGYTADKFVLNFREADEDNEPNWLGLDTEVVVVTDLDLDGDPATTEAALPMTLNPYTTYYWRVDSYEPNGVGTSIAHIGMPWKFRTAPVDPEIVTDPGNATAKEGTAVLTTKALNTVGVDAYHWKHNGVFVTASPVAEGTSETNGDYTVDCTTAGQSTLTITNVDELADEGTVSCVVSNDVSGTTVESADAVLLSERLMGWWKLDGDLTDSVATVVAGAATHAGSSIEPSVFVGAKDSSGLQITGTEPNQIVTIADSNDYFNFYPQGYTVSAWVKTTNPDNTWAIAVAKQKQNVSVTNPNAGFLLGVSPNGDGVTILRESFGDLLSGVPVDDDMWHLIIGTYDGSSGVGKVYVDGEIANQKTNPVVPTTHPYPLIFGAQLPSGSVGYTGILDDIRIYSYPLDGEMIADLYTSFNPGQWVCVGGMGSVDGDVSGPDGDPDCRVDLYDFAVFAERWLNCSRYPISYCN